MKHPFNIKSYLTFLSRNKGYTAINVFGLSISLMFVLLIGVYVYQEKSVDRENSKADRILVLGVNNNGQKEVGLHHYFGRKLAEDYPDVEAFCGIVQYPGIHFLKNGEYLKGNLLCADSTFFRIFDYKLLQGDRRTCLNDRSAAVITEKFARKYFGNENPMGKTITIDDSTRLHVTGILQNMDNTLLNKPDVIVNFYLAKYFNWSNSDDWFLNGTGGVNMFSATDFLLMRPGTTLIGQEHQISDFFHTFYNFFKSKELKSVIFIPLNKLYLSTFNFNFNNENIRHGNTTLVNILMTVSLVILLFAIINYINLTVAISGYRAREMATRRLFGAGKGEIRQNMIMESILLCLLSFFLAIVLSIIVAPYFGQMLDTDINISLIIRPVTLLLVLVFVIFIGILAGIIPTSVIIRAKPIEVMRGTFRHLTKTRLSRVFIVFQNTITITLLASAAIMVLQLHHLICAPLGFNTQHLLMVNNVYSDTDMIATFKNQLKQLACVKDFTASMGTPIDGGNNNTFFDKDKSFSLQYFIVDSHFMNIFGLHLKNRNEAQTGHYYLNAEALNELSIMPKLGTPQTFVKKNSIFGINSTDLYSGELQNFKIENIEEKQPPVLIDIKRDIDSPWTITIAIQGDMAEGWRQIAKAFHKAFHQQMDDDDAEFADKIIADTFAEEQRTSNIVSMFAFIAILISVLGLVAMSTYYIEQRRNEIAVRKVFGSTGNQIRMRLIRLFLLYVAIAFVIAVPIIWYFISKWISNYNYRIVWWPYILIAGILVGIISLASVAIQSWKASNENPAKVIKQE